VQRAPGIPCALFTFEGEDFPHNSGALRRENAKVCIRRHCERSEAIYRAPRRKEWIASLRSQ